MIIGAVYKIINTITNQFYIGSSKNFRFRKSEHLYKLRHNKHKNSYLQNSWNKYKEENFIFIIVEEIEDISRLIEREQFYLNQCIPFDKNKIYNSSQIAESPWHGRKHKEETKQLMREKHSGINNPFYGKKHSTETKIKMILNKPDVNGENNGMAKLNWVKVKEIREKYSNNDISQKKLSEEYNIGVMAINRIVNNTAWIKQ